MSQAFPAQTFLEPKLSHGFGVTRIALPGHLWNTLSAAPSEVVSSHGQEALV